MQSLGGGGTILRTLWRIGHVAEENALQVTSNRTPAPQGALDFRGMIGSAKEAVLRVQEFPPRGPSIKPCFLGPSLISRHLGTNGSDRSRGRACRSYWIRSFFIGRMVLQPASQLYVLGSVVMVTPVSLASWGPTPRQTRPISAEPLSFTGRSSSGDCLNRRLTDVGSQPRMCDASDWENRPYAANWFTP